MDIDSIRMEPEGGVPVFYPTWEQFKSFPDFIAVIEPMGMQTGICKVVPPAEWLERVPQLDPKICEAQVKIKAPIEQEALGNNGVYSMKHMLKRRQYSLDQWRKYCVAHSAPHSFYTPKQERQREAEQQLWEHDDRDFTATRCRKLEASYWRTMGYNSPIYGADVQGTLFQDLKEWNVAELESILSKLKVKIPGVNTAYLYCGSWKASFAWHLEDMDLHSINYIHFGAPKQWYSIPQADKDRFYELMKRHWPRESHKCAEFLRHKNYMVDPAVLEREGITVNKVVHRQREFMITFPYGYHAGFNLGYNVAESVNFATEAWIPIGRKSQPCRCEGDNASFDIRVMLGELEAAELEAVPEPVQMPSPHEPKRESKRKRVRDEFDPKWDEEVLPKGDQPLAAPAPTMGAPPKRKRTGECYLCPHQWDSAYLETDLEGEKVHEICAKIVPELWIEAGKVHGMHNISPSWFKLRCLDCKVATGACFQCEDSSCTKAYHPTCAASAGLVTEGGKYLCRHHRQGQGEDAALYASALPVGATVQCRVPGQTWRSFAGVVISQDPSDRTLEMLAHPNFTERVEVQWSAVVPGKFEALDRPPVVPKKKQKARPAAKPKEVAPSAKEEPAPFVPEPFVPKNTHLYGVEKDGKIVSPFIDIGVPLPACLQRTTAL